MSKSLLLLSRVVFVLAVCAVLAPSKAQAAFGPALPLAKSIKVELTVDGKAVRGTVYVAKNTEIELGWKATSVGAGAVINGCVGNWKDALLPTIGNETGVISASRQFVVTCYGRGAAQTAKVQVNVVYPDLSIGNFTIDGLTPVTVNGKKKTNSFVANATKAYALHAVIANNGAIDITKPFVVEFEVGTRGADKKISFGPMESKTVASLAKGSKITVDLPRPASSQPNVAYCFRARVDSTNVIDEGAKETNNSSSVIGGSTCLIFQ